MVDGDADSGGDVVREVPFAIAEVGDDLLANERATGGHVSCHSAPNVFGSQEHFCLLILHLACYAVLLPAPATIYPKSLPASYSS